MRWASIANRTRQKTPEVTAKRGCRVGVAHSADSAVKQPAWAAVTGSALSNQGAVKTDLRLKQTREQCMQQTLAERRPAGGRKRSLPSGRSAAAAPAVRLHCPCPETAAACAAPPAPGTACGKAKSERSLIILPAGLEARRDRHSGKLQARHIGKQLQSGLRWKKTLRYGAGGHDDGLA